VNEAAKLKPQKSNLEPDRLDGCFPISEKNEKYSFELPTQSEIPLISKEQATSCHMESFDLTDFSISNLQKKPLSTLEWKKSQFDPAMSRCGD